MADHDRGRTGADTDMGSVPLGSERGGLFGAARRGLGRLVGTAAVGASGERVAAPTRPAAALPRFGSSASDDLAAAGRSALGGTRLALAETLSSAHPVTDPERLAGRRETLKALIAAIEQSRQHVVLYGERGIGKTSLLHVLATLAREAGYQVHYASCSSESSFDETFREFARRVPLLYHARISPTEAEGEHGRAFADLLPRTGVGAGELGELFGNVMGTRLLLILDEYDRVGDPAFRRGVAELIKNLSDRAARVQLVLAGVASDLDELIGFAPSIRRNIAGLGVGPMTAEEMDDILSSAEDASGLAFSAGARALVGRMAGGSPHLVRLLGQRAALGALDDGRLDVAEADVRAGTQAVLYEWRQGLSRRVQAALDQPEARSAWPLLLAAARASASPEGWFGRADLAAAGAEGSDTAERLDALSGPGGLIEKAPPPEEAWRLITPALAQFLTLSAALARAEPPSGA